jgi:regulatory factor X
MSTQYSHLQPTQVLAEPVHHMTQQENVPQDPVQLLRSYDPNNVSVSHTPVPQSASYGIPLQPLDTNMQQSQHHQYTTSVTPSAASVETEEKKKKGGAAGNLTNDKELRELLKRNDGRRLNDVAAEVIATDRTSRAEKSKQLFAMLW